jgi:hypothetical protein
VGVRVAVGIFQGTKIVAMYEVTHGGGCSGTVCDAPIRLSKRDYGRVSRWCGANQFPITLPSYVAANVGVGEQCFGGGAWYANILVYRDATHGEDIAVNVSVLPPL